MTIKAKKSKINLREKLAELLNFRQIRDRLDGLGLYLGKDRTGTSENLAVRGGASIDDLQLAEISAALGGTAVDVFVYDTRNDSDGGKWRERTQHTSWYNEPLNTATRGGRREFPAVAVIVAESKKITIYDGDDPDLSMWMVFENTSGTHRNIMYGPGNFSNIYALNGFIMTGSQSTSFWSLLISFLRDGCLGIRGDAHSHLIYEGNLAERNVEHDLYWRGPQNDESWWLKDRTLSNFVKDMAMTVLPNAPIDDDTGLPVPTIAVATDGGVSVIRDDGSVVNISRSANPQVNSITFTSNEHIALVAGTAIIADYLVPIPSINVTDNDYGGIRFYVDQIPASSGTFDSADKVISIGGDDIAFGLDEGVNLLSVETNSPSGSMVSYITSTYNTGWMPGDIKLAALSDTKNEKIGHKNLITNGTFAAGANWSLGEDWSISGGLLTKVSGSNSSNTTQDIECIVGEEYVITFELISKTTGAVGVYTVSGGDLTGVQNYYNAPGVYSEKFTATSNSVTIAIRSGSTADLSVDNVSVVPVGEGELITNGTFDDGTTGWDDNSLGTGSVVYDSGTGTVKLTRIDGSNNGVLAQGMSLLAGKRYVLSFDTGSIVTSNIQIRGYTSSTTTTGSTIENSLAISANSSFMITFVAEAGEDGLEFRGVSGTNTYIYLDNISVRLAEPDRSVNDNGLQVFGEIEKTPVAPGADLVAYSGFSADDYLMQPYNSDLDFGTGDFCVMGWFKNANVNALLCARLLPQIYNTTGTDRGFLISFGSNGVLSFATYTQGFQSGGRKSIGSQNDMSGIDGWAHFVAVRDGGVMKLYINAIKETSEVANSDDISDDTTSIPLSIGCFNEISANRFTGSTALIRISSTAPTAEQIAKIYRDEKALFQDGAGATLYGTSDAVTALAYDDKTELLHVGTSSGRSDFAGLRRINNTTTAVTTSISASNNLIAEQ